MTKRSFKPSAPLPAPKPLYDASAYTEVVITKAGELFGHPYRKGTVHMVDAATLEALKAAGLVAA